MEPAAQFARAQTILSSPKADQDDFEEAVALVESASAAAFPQATEMVALFEAMGVGRVQSWDRAFDALRSAAEQGSQSAQAQLRLLSASGQEGSPAPDSSWAELRDRISLEALLRHGERRSLCDGPRIRVIEGFASADECRWLIDRARSRLKEALIFDADGRQALDPGRSNRGAEFQLFDMDLVVEMVRARISAATNIPVPVFEPTQLLHYSVGQEFKPHRDFLEPDNPHHREQMRTHGQRIATFLIYLNEDFEGGETEFPEAGVKYRGRTGDALFWANVDMQGRPDPRTLHAGTPPSAGEKWILSQWIRDRAGQGR